MGRTRKLLILLLVMVLLMGIYVLVSRWSAAEEEGGLQSNLISILAFEPEDVISLHWEYQGEDGRESYTLEKKDGEWTWPQDESLLLDQEAVEQMLYNISSLSATQQLEPAADSDLEQYGLGEEPYSAISLKFTEESGNPDITLLTGNYSSIAEQYYAMIDGQAEIYLVEGTYTESYMCTPADLEYVEETEEDAEE